MVPSYSCLSVLPGQYLQKSRVGTITLEQSNLGSGDKSTNTVVVRIQEIVQRNKVIFGYEEGYP